MAAQLLTTWGPTVVRNLPTILMAADGLYRAYCHFSDSTEKKNKVDEAMKLIEEKQGDIDRLMEDNKKMQAVLEGLTHLMDRLNQHYENMSTNRFLHLNTMGPPCFPHHHNPWGPPGCHHGGPGCHHHGAGRPSECCHRGTGGPPECHYHGNEGPSGCHHHDARGPSGSQHCGGSSHPGCHHKDPQRPSHYPWSTQLRMSQWRECGDDSDDEECGAASTESSSREGSWRECCVCRRNYNMTDRRPIILACGHTFCRKCLGKVAQRGPLLCPTCRTLEKRTLSLLPPNVVLMVALEEEGGQREDGTQNNDVVDDWKKRSTLLQEQEELLMQMVLQISNDVEDTKDENDWKKTNALLQEEEDLQMQMALHLSKTEAEASEDKDDLKTSSLLLEEEELNIQLALHLSLQYEVGCSAMLNSENDPEDNGNLQTVMKIRDSCNKLEKQVTDGVLPKVGKISLGLIEAGECRRELVRFRKELTSANERLMCYLEQLDTIDFQSTDFQGRQRKKFQVKKILNLMDQFDKMLENIDQLMLNYIQ